MSEPELRREIARMILAQVIPCEDHPWPLPRPSCWLCARNGAFHRAALIALRRWPVMDLGCLIVGFADT